MIHFDIANLQKQLKALENKTLEANFWENSEESNKVLNKIKTVKSKCTNYKKLENEINNLIDIIEFLKLEYDDGLASEMVADVKNITLQVEKFEIETLLSGKYDKNNAILTIHPGARRDRGTEIGQKCFIECI